MQRLWFLAFVLFLLVATLFTTGRVLISRLETVPRASAPSGPHTSFVATRSGRVHVLDAGAGDAILLLHGSGRSVADWQEGFAELLAADHRVVAFDNYGFGASDRDHGLGYGNALWARQAIDVLDALAIERAAIVGHSAGGVVAAFLAADRPERIRGAVFVGHGMAMDPAQILPFLPGIGELWVAQGPVFGSTFSKRHRRRLEAAYRIEGTRAALLTFIRRQYTIDGLRLLNGTYEDISVPVLQVHGSRDASIPIEAAQALGGRLRDTRFVTVEGASHDVHIDAPDQLAEEVSDFVAGLQR